MQPNPAILFSDEALLVINKPAGLLSIPDGYDPNKPHLRGVLEPEYGPLWIVHRLDKDTSGVIVLARNAGTHRDLNTQFSVHRVEKIYHAIVVGTPPWNDETIHAPLRPNVGRRKRTVVDPQRGKQAVTIFRVLNRLKEHTLLQANPKTGRTHQIRAHLYSLGYPVLVDPLYGTGKASPFIQRSALHAQYLTFEHPETAERVSFSAPYPDDFKLALDYLRE
jgi:RluA family pseudouridine synthase